MKEQLIAEILAIEWEMFQNVANIGGQAACQKDFKTFNIMRSSQAIAWSEATLTSYLDDLARAQMQGRNLLTEKYARMMEFTAPLEYARIQEHLPPLEEETLSLIDKIIKISLAWEKELREKFPYIRQQGRPASASDDRPYLTSIETYLRGELATYSPQTLALYCQNALEQQAANINGAQLVLSAMTRQYGFTSLAKANETLKSQAQSKQVCKI